MPTLNQVRNLVDNKLANYWPTIVARQTNYIGTHDNYWQGLATSLNIPPHRTAEYVERLPDQLGLTPSDVAEDWNMIFPEVNSPLPYLLIMDVYESLEGHGFVAIIFVQYNGTIYTRSQNYGPLTSLTVPWHVAIDPEEETE